MTLTTRGSIHRNSYRDSVELMGIAAQLEALDGIQRAGLVMATPANLAVLAEAGLADAVPEGASPNDLIVAVAATDEATADSALARAAALLTAGGDSSDGPTEAPDSSGPATTWRRSSRRQGCTPAGRTAISFSRSISSPGSPSARATRW